MACALVTAAGALIGAGAAAGTDQQLPDGVPIGRWLVLSYFQVSEEGDDNVFRYADSVGPEPDRITTLSLGVLGQVPVRRSLLELSYDADQAQYELHSFERNFNHRFAGAFHFNFSTGDTLVLRENYTVGFSDVGSIDAGGELVFIGEPYDLNRAEIAVERAEPSRPGYAVRIGRTDFNFVGHDPVPFFDYRGWDGDSEYRQPLAGHRWLTFGYGWRSFDHFESNVPEQVGVPFRSEEGDTWSLGLRGTLRGKSPYVVRAGYTHYRLDGLTFTEFTGLGVSAEMNVPLGGATVLRASLSRQPLPSSYDTYYINNYLRVAAERPWLEISRVGFEVWLSRNAYGGPLRDPVTGEPVTACGDDVRTDRTVRLGGYVDWVLHRRLVFRVAAGHEQRDSSCEAATYAANEVMTGFRLGWF